MNAMTVATRCEVIYRFIEFVHVSNHRIRRMLIRFLVAISPAKTPKTRRKNTKENTNKFRKDSNKRVDIQYVLITERRPCNQYSCTSGTQTHQIDINNNISRRIYSKHREKESDNNNKCAYYLIVRNSCYLSIGYLDV